MTPLLEERFWAQVKKVDLGCWLWTGPERRGFGVMRVGKRLWRARDLAFYFKRGRMPSEAHSKHPSCGNDLCVRC